MRACVHVCVCSYPRESFKFPLQLFLPLNLTTCPYVLHTKPHRDPTHYSLRQQKPHSSSINICMWWHTNTNTHAHTYTFIEAIPHASAEATAGQCHMSATDDLWGRKPKVRVCTLLEAGRSIGPTPLWTHTNAHSFIRLKVRQLWYRQYVIYINFNAGDIFSLLAVCRIFIKILVNTLYTLLFSFPILIPIPGLWASADTKYQSDTNMCKENKVGVF